MGINKVSVINSGSYINPNVFTRNISKSYETMGTQINIVADTLTFGDRAPVPDTGDARWSWVVESFFPENGTINPYTKGLDGTSIYVYAGTDYLGIDSLFLQINPEVSTEKRPATVYETFLNYKKYIDTSIQQRTAALLSIVANNGLDLSGVLDGTILISTAEEIDVSSWRFIADYPVSGSSAFRMPGGNNLMSTAAYVSIDAPLIKFDSNAIAIAAPSVVPSGALANYGRVYYESGDNRLHLVDQAGVDNALALGSDSYSHTEAVADNTTWPLVMTTNSTTYLINGSESYSLTLPAIADVQLGWEITIADKSNQASLNPIQISTVGSDTFVGYAASTIIIDNDSGLVRLQVTSEGWLILYTK